MKHTVGQKKAPSESGKLPQPTIPDQFVCCQCNCIISKGELRQYGLFDKRCGRGHLVIRLHPPVLDFLQGLGWGSVIMFGAAYVAEVSYESPISILGFAGVLCSAMACVKMLQGITYRKLPEPANILARQQLSEAVGAWVAVIMSTLFTFR